MKNLLSNFSHVYVEADAVGYPITDLVLKKFTKSEIIYIKNYKDIFNRSGQDFQSQKASMKLILSKKNKPFLYPVSEMIQEYTTPNYFYTTPMVNCLYNCDYCFLQGMYQSANLVVYVNDEDFMKEIDNQLNRLKNSSNQMFVSVSYNTDLMAMESIIPLTSRWIHYASKSDNLNIEIRTKSAILQPFKTIEPSNNVILSWTLSPEKICEGYEKNAPPLKSRLTAVKTAIKNGWRVRLCFDPIIIIDNYKEIYGKFINEVFNDIDSSKLDDVTIGVFRMNKDYFNRIRRREPKSDIFFQNYITEYNTVMPEHRLRKDAVNFIEKNLLEFIPETKILSWK